MPTRVLWVIKGLGPGGAETLLVAAARAHDLDRFDIECAYVLPWKDHLASSLERAGVRANCLSTRRRDLRWPFRLWQLVRSGEWAVVHVHSPLPGSVARLAVRTISASRRPTVLTTEHNRWDTHRLPTRVLNRFTSRWDVATLAVSDEVRQSIHGSATHHIQTVRHGIDVAATATMLAHRDAVRAEFGLSPDDIVVGTVANFRAQKDYPNLLNAARALADRQDHVRFVAIGQGPQEAQIRARCTELGLDDRFTLTGFRSDAVRVMAGFDIFVLASQWEGLPVAMMEAMALGLPIVATNVGGVAEELTNDIDALLVPPGEPAALAEALERVATYPDLRRQLARAAQARSPEFDVARTIEIVEATYCRLAEGGDESTSRRPPSAEPPIPPTNQSAAPRKSSSSRSAQARSRSTQIRPATQADRAAILELLDSTLGGDGDQRYAALFAWKHDENPFGPSPMWVATEDDRVVAFRTFMRWEFERGGVLLRAVRAVDTATHPAHQGQGLFTALTMHGLDEMRADGVDFVFNTPNTSSRPGYLKMGWREIGCLPTAVHFVGARGAIRSARARVPADRWSKEISLGEPFGSWLAGTGPAGRTAKPTDVRQLHTRLGNDYLAWRFGTPLLGYRVVDDGDSAIVVRARRRGSATELAVVAMFGDLGAADRLATAAAKAVGADYAIRLGHAHPAAGFIPLPRAGPMLTWRALADAGEPPLPNWALTLGDIELF
jgi:glycosyltransferase involved in cell wall biosynthesis/predicted N-acetyltransferase YhbS